MQPSAEGLVTEARPLLHGRKKSKGKNLEGVQATKCAKARCACKLVEVEGEEGRSMLKIRKGGIPRKDDTWRASGGGNPRLVENEKRRRSLALRNITR